MRLRVSYPALAALLLLADTFAYGGDFLTSGGGARSAGLGGIYLPASDDVLDAMAINPAGLALLSAPTLDFALEGGLATGQFTRSGGSDGHLNATGVVPFGAFGMPLGRDGVARHFSFGVAALPQLLSSAKWNYTDPPGGVGGVSYGALHSDSEITAIRAAAGIGIYLGWRLQIGATVGATYNSNKLQTAYVFQNYAPLAGLKTLLDLRTSGVGWNGSAGALVRVSRRVQLGASYQSRTRVRSTGAADGNAGVQFAAIGLGGARPDFRYNAEVDNVLPQSVTASGNWQVASTIRLAAQVDWINWSAAFRKLPVILHQGNNQDINGLLGTDAITDFIPLDWHDQVVVRLGVEKPWRERAVFRAGYAHANTPVPSSTLSPLTAAITRHSLTAGAGYTAGRWRFDAAYSIDPDARESVGQSALKSGEFSNTSVRVGIQALILTTSLRL